MLRISSPLFLPRRRKDFQDVRVRRLDGMFRERLDAAKQGIDKLDELLIEERYEVTFEEVQKLLAYELEILGIE